MVKLLVASGAEVDCKDKKAYTPLHAAASSGMSSTVHYLLSLGVNVSTHKCTHEHRLYYDPTINRILFSERSMRSMATAIPRFIWPATTDKTW